MPTQFFLINHTLSDICITQNNILLDIAVCLSEVIVKKVWSCTDKIEVYCYRDNNKSYIRNLIIKYMYDIDCPMMFLNEDEIKKYMYEPSEDDNYDF